MTEKNESQDIDFRGIESRLVMELDACTNCGECEKWCPTADATEDKDVAPRTKITRWRDYVNRKHGLRAKIFGEREVGREELEQFKEDLYTCTTCGTCEEVCPVNIETVELWESLRQNLVLSGIGPYGKQEKFPSIIKKYKNPYMEEKEERVNWIPDDIEIEEEAEVGYYAGCTASLRQREVATASMRILNDLDIPFTYLGEEEECCGSVLLRAGVGRSEEGMVPKELAKKNVEALEERGVKKLLFSCAGCYRTAKLDWPELIGREPEFDIIHISEYIADLMRKNKIDIDWKQEINCRVAYHDPCHLRLDMEVFEDPRYVLEQIPGVEIEEMERSEKMARCCGAGGGVKGGQPEVALKSAVNRCGDALDVNAEMLASTCPFCRRNLGDAAEEMEEEGEIEEILDVDDLVVLLAKAMGLETELEEN